MAAFAVCVFVALGQTIGAAPSQESLEDLQALMADRWDLAVLEQCIARADEALTRSPENPELRVLLAQLWHEYAIRVEEGTTAWMDALKQAADYACQAMGLDTYVRLERLSAAELEAHLAHVDSPGALLWAGDSWGKILGTHQLHAFRVNSVGKLRLIYGRLIEVDPDYFGGAGHRSLGALESNVATNAIARWMFGGSADEARAHFEQALEHGPEYLMNHVEYASHLAGPLGEWELFDDLLHHVLEAPLAPEPFWNTFAKEEALRFLRQERRPIP